MVGEKKKKRSPVKCSKGLMNTCQYLPRLISENQVNSNVT